MSEIETAFVSTKC